MITASCGDIKAECQLTVEPPIEGVQTYLSDMDWGNSFLFSYTVGYASLALDAGVTHPSELFTCTHSYKVAGVTLHCWRPQAHGVETLEQAGRCLSGHRESDGFQLLSQKGRLDLSLEALAVKKQFHGLFTDEQINNALDRLLWAGYRF